MHSFFYIFFNDLPQKQEILKIYIWVNNILPAESNYLQDQTNGVTRSQGQTFAFIELA